METFLTYYIAAIWVSLAAMYFLTDFTAEDLTEMSLIKILLIFVGDVIFLPAIFLFKISQKGKKN